MLQDYCKHRAEIPYISRGENFADFASLRIFNHANHVEEIWHIIVLGQLEFIACV